MKISD